MKPHKHAEVIKAWADGHTIQARTEVFEWVDIPNPTWLPTMEYRIKPEPTLDFEMYTSVYPDNNYRMVLTYTRVGFDNLKLIFDGETGKLKGSEVLK